MHRYYVDTHLLDDQVDDVGLLLVVISHPANNGFVVIVYHQNIAADSTATSGHTETKAKKRQTLPTNKNTKTRREPQNNMSMLTILYLCAYSKANPKGEKKHTERTKHPMKK